MKPDAIETELRESVLDAIINSKLDWPVYGQVIVRALTDYVGNPVVLQVSEGGTVLEFDGCETRGWNTNPQALAGELIKAMPGETLEEQLTCALAALGGAAKFRGCQTEWRRLLVDATSS